MNKIVEIRRYLANKFNNECSADEILSFFVDMEYDFRDFENFTSYPFMTTFPGLEVQIYDDLKTQFKNCLSMKFICNLNVEMEIGNKGALVIARSLKTNFTIQKSSLNRNEIGDKGAIVIANALKTNSTIQKINLNYNEIGDKGVIAIIEALKTNSTLEEINLEGNNIGDKGMIAIVEALKTNSTIQKINSNYNQMGASLKQYYRQV